MIEGLNISKLLRRAVIHQPLIAGHITSTGHCKIEEILLIRELQPALNENVGNDKLFLYLLDFVLFYRFQIEVCLFEYFFIFLIRYQSLTLRLNLFVIFPTVTSEDVC